MKYFLISDNVDTLAGMRLVGVAGVIVHTGDELKTELAEICKNKEIGIVLITSKLCSECRDLVFDYKLNCPRPIIVEMPDRHSGNDVGSSIKKYISEVIGIKI